MNATLLQEHRQQILLGMLGVIALVGLGVVWYVFWRSPFIESITTQPPPPRAVELNFQVFEDPAFLELGAPPREIPPSQNVGRNNPFTPQ